jgi:hypothetical protein
LADRNLPFERKGLAVKRPIYAHDPSAVEVLRALALTRSLNAA